MISFRHHPIARTMLACGLVFFLNHEAYAFCAEVHRYLVRNDKYEHHILWELQKDGQNILHLYKSDQRKDTTIIEPEFDTRMWSVEAPDEQTEFTATRQGETIDMHGRFHGTPIHKKIRIDHCPWFQSLSVSLKSITARKRSEINFWLIRPDNLKAYKLVATRKGLQTLVLDGIAMEAIRVEIRPCGVLALLWKGNCWFSKDGLFLKYKGAGGLSGTSETVVEYCHANWKAGIDHQRQGPWGEQIADIFEGR